MTDEYYKSLLNFLLFTGFVDIRTSAAQEDATYARYFQISDFLHNIPLGMNDCHDYRKLYEEVRERAKMKKCEKWLNSTVKSFEERQKNLKRGF